MGIIEKIKNLSPQVKLTQERWTMAIGKYCVYGGIDGINSVEVACCRRCN